MSRFSPRVAYASVGIALVVALATLGINGHGLPALGMQLRSGQAWLSNLTNNSVSFVDGYSGEVVSQVQVEDATSKVVNTPEGAVVVGQHGRLTRVSNADFTTSSSVELLGGGSLTTAAGGSALYAVNLASGQIQQLDPAKPSLPPIGSPVLVGSRIVTPVVAPDGSLYVGIPKTGAVGRLRDGLLSVIKGVAKPGDQLAVVLAGSQPVGADLTVGQVRPLGAIIAGPAVQLPARALPVRQLTGSDSVNGLVGAVGPDSVESVNLTTAVVSSTPLPAGYQPTSAAMQGRNVVLIDASRPGVLFVNTASHATRMLPMPGGRPASQLTVQDGLVFVNASGGPHAMVINGAGHWRPVTKYTSPPPPPHTPPATLPPAPAPAPAPAPVPTAQPAPTLYPSASPSSPSPPFRSPWGTQPPRPSPSGHPKRPGAPSDPTARPSDAAATVSWGAALDNGSPITGYLLTWSGGSSGSLPLPADKTSASVTRLDNGSAYTFAVKAKNAVGWGPAASTKPVTPSSTIPKPPTDVRAAATTGDGSVTLTWTEPGNGDQVASYTVTNTVTGITETAITGTSAIVSDVVNDGTAFTTPPATFTFTVTAVDAAGNVSAPSSASNAVTPFLAPGTPTVDTSNLQYSADGTSVTLTVSCGVTCQRGDAVQSYTVDAGSGKAPVTQSAAADGAPTAVTVSGLTPNTSYSAQVTAKDDNDTSTAVADALVVPLASPGPPTVTAVTVSQPTVAVGAGAAIGVAVAVNPGGESGTCTYSISVSGGGSAPGISCGTTGPVTIAVPSYDTVYSVTVTAANAAGSAPAYNPTSGTSSLEALSADASTAFGPDSSCGGGSPVYCGSQTGVESDVNGPSFNADNVTLLPVDSTVYADCQVSGGKDTGTYGAYKGVASYQWVHIASSDGGPGYMSDLWFPAPSTAAAGLPSC